MKDNKKNEVFTLNLEDMIPVSPTFPVKSYQEWVNFGVNNSYPKYLAELYDQSALHSAIINSKIDYSAGDGVTYEGEPNLKTDEMIAEVYPGEDFNTFFRKILTDYIITGNYCFSIIKQKDNKDKIYYYHYPVSKIAANKKNSKGEIESYWYSNDWDNYRKQGNKPIEIKTLGFGSDKEEQMVYYKDYRMNQDYYGLPTYQGALKYVEIDTEISTFHLSALRNGMAPSAMINYYNVPEGEEREEIVKNWKDKKSGTKNAAKFILGFHDGKENAPTIDIMEASNLDKQFIQLSEQTLQQILSGHRITSPLLVGIKTEGQLGGNSELVVAFNLFYDTVIKPIQVNCLKEINKINLKYNYEELSILTNQPVDFTWSENILKDILTEEEMRTIIGYENNEDINTIK